MHVISTFVADVISRAKLWRDNQAAYCSHMCVPVNWQAFLWRKTEENNNHMSPRHSGAFLCHSCLQVKTNSGYPWFQLKLQWRGGTVLMCVNDGAHNPSLELMKDMADKQQATKAKSKTFQCCSIESHKTFASD